MKETSRSRYDAVVVGAGPNGLVAAIELATRGASVLLIEAAETVGGGMKTSNLTLDGFLHDDCSAIHPMILGSPALRSLRWCIQRFLSRIPSTAGLPSSSTERSVQRARDWVPTEPHIGDS
jgi:phytoene dehydrogenase-like protein